MAQMAAAMQAAGLAFPRPLTLGVGVGGFGGGGGAGAFSAVAQQWRRWRRSRRWVPGRGG